MENLEKMAELIRQNPSITVKGLAQKLGYSEERSIYYWLEKAHFKGIKAFKHAVLTGSFPPGQRKLGADLDRVREPEVAPAPSPGVYLARSFKSDGTPVLSTEKIAVNVTPLSPRAFAVVIDEAEYSPVVLPGDVLIIDPQAPLEDGRLTAFWLSQNHQRLVLRRIYGKKPLLLIHPAQWGHAPGSSPPAAELTLIGPVVCLIRSL
ncbi:MAG: hypothetical protein QJR13_08610 [Bacillota bacterium]|nr:hypothetical protein [Bacillota bacterium]